MPEPTVTAAPVSASLRRDLDGLAGRMLDAWNILEDAIADAERLLEVLEYLHDAEGLSVEEWQASWVSLKETAGYEMVDDLLALVFDRLYHSPTVAGGLMPADHHAIEQKVMKLRRDRFAAKETQA